MKYGWISPNGKLYECSYCGHSSLADRLVKRYYPKSRTFRKDELLLYKGWVKLSANEWFGRIDRVKRKTVDQLLSNPDYKPDKYMFLDRGVTLYPDHVTTEFNRRVANPDLCLCEKYDLSHGYSIFFDDDERFSSSVCGYCPDCGKQRSTWGLTVKEKCMDHSEIARIYVVIEKPSSERVDIETRMKFCPACGEKLDQD